MVESTIGSVVRFEDNRWGVYTLIECNTYYEKYLGISILVAEYFARMYATVRKDVNARQHLIRCLQNPDELASFLAGTMEGYAEYYKTDPVELAYDLSTTENAKKEVEFIIRYTRDGNYKPKFNPKGFGLLGKNIEASASSACIATAVQIIASAEEDELDGAVVHATISSIAEKILRHDKLSTRDEYMYVQQTALEVVSRINL